MFLVLDTVINPTEVEHNITTDSPASNISTPTRKRKQQISNWKRNIAKRLRTQGKEYIGKRDVLHLARTIKKTCSEHCNYKCNVNFSIEDRQVIHDAFWKLDPNSKLHFYSKFTKQKTTARKRTNKEVSRRVVSYQYYFQSASEPVQVCKVFFLNTLDISQNRIYYYYREKHNENVGVSKPVVHGKHIKFQTPESELNKVREHIKQFPVMDSHYCRANSLKKYLDPGLSLNKMYNMYKSSIDNPVKLNIYSKIFNEEFNFSFHHPKKDQCDRCVAFNNSKSPTDGEKKLYENHRKANELAKLERDNDRKNQDDTIAVICYDLQNVFALPRANVSSFYYRRKFSVYNLTAHCSKNKITYCALWNEALSGRSGNDIASALIKILECVVEDNPTITKLILWSDSCVPQNKNRITTLGLLKFLEKHHRLVEIQQKFSEPGHSQIQEIDAVHSCIDRNLKNLEIFSPVSLIRLLKTINSTKVHLKLIQLKSTDIYNYKMASGTMNFPPFSSINHITYHSTNLLEICFRKEFIGEFSSIKLISSKTRKQIDAKLELPKKINQCHFHYNLTQEKLKDLRAMLNFMPDVDKAFYNIYLK